MRDLKEVMDVFGKLTRLARYIKKYTIIKDLKNRAGTNMGEDTTVGIRGFLIGSFN